MTGKSIAHFDILEELGRGGMGVVYKARDQRLDRVVALKLLPPDTTNNPDRHRRFVQEARSASALNHPNIVHVYEIGESDGVSFIAMEHVQGKTLGSLIPPGGLRLNELLRYSGQIAAALTAAHARGIIHRDLKPSNVMVSDSGDVKLLDFGLAKLIEPSTGQSEATRTLAQSLTAEGTVVGTTAYMSPEQAEGKHVDARSDIFSFGAMLYEMVTGRRPFSGDSHLAVLSAILRDDPAPIQETRGDLPPELDRILIRCLRKDPDRRFQHTGDLNVALQELREESDSGVARTAPFKPQRARNWKLPAAIAAVVLGGLVLWRFGGSLLPKASHGTLQAAALTTVPGLAFGPSLSPDGKEFAFSSNRSGRFEIYVRSANPGGAERQITSDGQQNIEPTWSPNGSTIAFHSAARRGIWAVPTSGGTPVRQLAPFGSHPVWSPDGSKVAFRSTEPSDLAWFDMEGSGESVIFTVGFDGSDLRQITTAGNPEGKHADPAWSADGKQIVFTSLGAMGTRTAKNSLWTVDLNSGVLTPIKFGSLGGASSPVLTADNKTIYFSALAPDGFGIFATSTKGTDESIPIYRSGREAPMSLHLSRDGRRLFFAHAVNVSQIWQTQAGSQESIALYQDEVVRAKLPAYSPDGKQIAYVVQPQDARQDLWVMNADGSNPRVLVSEPGYVNGPGWSADGKSIYFSFFVTKKAEIRQIPAGGGPQTTVFESPKSRNRARVSPDQREFIYDVPKPVNIWSQPLPNGAPKQLTFEREGAGFPRFSPNGDWIAYGVTSGESTFVAVMDRHGGQQRMLVKEPGSHYAYGFSDDNRRIAYAACPGGVWNIFWVDRITGHTQQVTNYTAYGSVVRSPEWRPGTEQLAYEFTQVKGNVAVLELSK